MNPSSIDVEARESDQFGEGLALIAARISESLPHCIVQPVAYDRMLADSPLRMIGCDSSGQPRAFILISSREAPGYIARTVERAERAAKSLPAQLASAVLLPHTTGDIEGRTFAIFPYARPFSESKVIRKSQTMFVRGSIFRWLHDAVSATLTQCESGDDLDEVKAALQCIECDGELSRRLRCCAAEAARSIESGTWRPCFTLVHNDFCIDNVLRGGVVAGGHRFAVIDWAGATTRGYPVYDLVRMCRSLGLGVGSIRRQMQRHADAIGYGFLECSYSLCASLGRIGGDLEHFPRNRYVQLVESCWKCVEDSIGTEKTGEPSQNEVSTPCPSN